MNLWQLLLFVRSNLKNTVPVLLDLGTNPLKRPQSAANDVEGVEYCRLHHVWILTSHESHPFCRTLVLQLSFYCHLCYNSRAHYPLLQFLRTTSAILAGAHSYFVVSFKCEGENSCYDLIPNPRTWNLWFPLLVGWGVWIHICSYNHNYKMLCCVGLLCVACCIHPRSCVSSPQFGDVQIHCIGWVCRDEKLPHISPSLPLFLPFPVSLACCLSFLSIFLSYSICLSLASLAYFYILPCLALTHIN
jgi:hypothetical protein